MPMILPITLDHLPSRALFETAPPSELFHYTNFSGASGIFASKSLWLTKFTASNDASELRIAKRHFQSLAESQSGHLPTAEGAFLREAAAQLESFGRANICIASFCEKPDLLSQWRSYGNDGTGLALGFDATQLKTLAGGYSLRLVRCVYDQRLHVQLVSDLITLLLKSFRLAGPETQQQRRELLSFFNTTFLLMAPVLKDQHFAEECEWRLVSMPRSVNDPHLTALMHDSRASVMFALPLRGAADSQSTLVSSVKVGPMLDPQGVADAIEVLSEKNGFHIRSIGFSQIPYRGHP